MSPRTLGDIAFLTVSRHVIRAAKNPVDLDQRQVDAVAARIELDLRIGFAFTRLQTNSLRPLGGPLAQQVLSYGGLVVVQRGCIVRQANIHRIMSISYTGFCGRSIL